jgi:hypothetical protein
VSRFANPRATSGPPQSGRLAYQDNVAFASLTMRNRNLPSRRDATAQFGAPVLPSRISFCWDYVPGCCLVRPVSYSGLRSIRAKFRGAATWKYKWRRMRQFMILHQQLAANRMPPGPLTLAHEPPSAGFDCRTRDRLSSPAGIA